MENPLFKIGRDQLVLRSRQGDQAAAQELVRRGRDPQTGLKTSGLGARIGKAVSNPSRDLSALSLWELKRRLREEELGAAFDARREALGTTPYNQDLIDELKAEIEMREAHASHGQDDVFGYTRRTHHWNDPSFGRSNPSLKTSRQRKKMMRGVKVFHADHGITRKQKEYIVSKLRATAPQGFFVKQVNIPKRLGSVPNALYGPDAGDPPVQEGQVYYASRGGRPVQDRLVRAAPRPWQYVQTIGIRDGEDFTIFTIYGGPLAPMHPDDPNNRDPEGSRKWWSQHALADGQWAAAAR